MEIKYVGKFIKTHTTDAFQCNKCSSDETRNDKHASWFQTSTKMLFGWLQNQDEDEVTEDNQLLSAEYQFSSLHNTFMEVGFLVLGTLYRDLGIGLGPASEEVYLSVCVQKHRWTHQLLYCSSSSYHYLLDIFQPTLPWTSTTAVVLDCHYNHRCAVLPLGIHFTWPNHLNWVSSTYRKMLFTFSSFLMSSFWNIFLPLINLKTRISAAWILLFAADVTVQNSLPWVIIRRSMVL